jgi:hypothetical protein
MAIDSDRSSRCALETDEVSHEHRLPRLRRSEDEERLAPRDEQIDVEDQRRTRRPDEAMYLERALRGRGRG